MIDKLEMFLALARERHFGRAAESLGLTQPSLSSAIRQLEDQLGVQLVFRGSRFQGLTPEGLRMLERARHIVAETRALRDEMRSLRHGLSGRLRLGVIPTALPRVAELTAPFLAAHPQVRLTILSLTSAEILTGIEALEIDAGITYLDNEPLGKVAQVPLFRETYRVIARAGSPLAQRAEVTWAEAAAHPLCLLTTDMQNRRIISQLLADAAAPGQGPALPQVESNSTMALAAHVATGIWASIVPEALARSVAGGPGLSGQPGLAEADDIGADHPGTDRPGSADHARGAGRIVSRPIAGRQSGHRIGLIAPWREPHPPMLAALLEAANRLARGRADLARGHADLAPGRADIDAPIPKDHAD